MEVFYSDHLSFFFFSTPYFFPVVPCIDSPELTVPSSKLVFLGEQEVRAVKLLEFIALSQRGKTTENKGLHSLAVNGFDWLLQLWLPDSQVCGPVFVPWHRSC